MLDGDLGTRDYEYKLLTGTFAMQDALGPGMPALITTLKWIASISGVIAALMVSLDLGRRVTGWGFVLFVGSSVTWIAGAALSNDPALGTQNACLFLINLFGVYRYLIRKKPV